MNLLHRLLCNPEYIEPLRHDVETAVAEEGWTKVGMDKMDKIDSFLRETQRIDDLDSCLLDSPGRTSITVLILYSLFPVAINRLALRPFTFSNGVTVPAGTLITVPNGVIHKDEEIYPNPENLMASASRSSVSIVWMPYQDTKHFLRLWTTSLLDMGDMLGVFFCFCLNPCSHSYFPDQSWSLLRSQ